jgi:hypothetical protein
MAKPYPKFGPYNIIADTNALYAQDSRKLVSGGFEVALTELRTLASVQLYIPDVVIGEMAYQKLQMAAAAIASVNGQLNILNLLTGTKQPTICSTEQAKKKILKRYADWRKSVNAQRFIPNIKQTAWNKIVEDAIWRIPPFEHSDDKKHEKGFRDRVVLESVIQMCSKNANQTVLLCEDGLLTKAAGVCGAKNLTIVPRLEDFTSRVRLLKEKETKEWGESLFAEAKREFYDKDKPDCFYRREKVYKRILERSGDLTPPEDNTFVGILGPKTWERQAEERITLGTTQYEKHEAGRYYWKTEVKSAAAFSGQGLLSSPFENIRISTFAIRWSSQVNSDAEIKDVKFENIALVGKQMILDTIEARSQWSLPAKPVPVLPATPVTPSLADMLANLSLPTTPPK